MNRSAIPGVLLASPLLLVLLFVFV
ncbi:MAG: hypothetical protein JWQ73_748, partial [Variovorax sp.]|nr:hypothetical protein [Variovorax sp.]